MTHCIASVVPVQYQYINVLLELMSLCMLLLQDYYNLVDVYLDAVLQPRCVTDPRTFAQEGWHYELDDAKVTMSAMHLHEHAL